MAQHPKPDNTSNTEDASASSLSELATAFSRLAVAFEAFTSAAAAPRQSSHAPKDAETPRNDDNSLSSVAIAIQAPSVLAGSATPGLATQSSPLLLAIPQQPFAVAQPLSTVAQSQPTVAQPSVAVAQSLSVPADDKAALAPSLSTATTNGESAPVKPSLIDECIAAAVLSGEFQAVGPSTTVGPVTQIPLAPAVPPIPVMSPTQLALHVANIPDQGPWYLVTQGKEPGIYPTWGETSPLVTRVSCAVHVKVGSKVEALTMYMQAWMNGNVIRRV